MAKNAAKKITPVATEYAAHADCFCTTKRRAKTKHEAISPRNPTPPLTKCIRPCVLIVRGGTGGVPGGTPRGGSTRKLPAAIRPSSYTPSSNGPQVPDDSSERARRI